MTDKFKSFINFIIRSNRNNFTIIEIFNHINNLYNELENELIHFKPTLIPEQFNAHIDAYIYNLNKLNISTSSKKIKINKWLKAHHTAKSEFLTWHDIIPQENILYTILSTDLEMHTKIEYPYETNYSTLHNYSYPDVQEIQEDFENFIKDLYVEKLKRCLLSLKDQKSKIFSSKKENKPFKDFFVSPYNNDEFLNQLNYAFSSNSLLKGKGYAIMTHLLVKSKCINLGGELSSFMRSWYEFIGRSYSSKETFKGVRDYLDLNQEIYKLKDQYLNKDKDFNKLNELFLITLERFNIDTNF